MICPRNHGDLKYRNPNIPIDDLPLSIQNAYRDSVERGCGHDKVARTVRLEDKMEGQTVTEVQETESLTGPADSTQKVTAKVARKPKSCSICGLVGANTRTHGKSEKHPDTTTEAQATEAQPSA